MTFVSHPACSSGFIYNFLDHYAALQMQKAVSAYLQSEQILPFGLHGSMPIIGSIVGSMMYMPCDSPFIS